MEAAEQQGALPASPTVGSTFPDFDWLTLPICGAQG